MLAPRLQCPLPTSTLPTQLVNEASKRLEFWKTLECADVLAKLQRDFQVIDRHT